MSSQATWTAVDQLFEHHFVPADDAASAALAASRAAGLPAISVSPSQGKLLELFVRMLGAKRVLELGTLGGYSTIWMANALPKDGQVVTFELEPHHATVARTNLAHAGLTDRVDVRVGPALELLADLAAQAAPPFDLVFIDADKPNNPHYVRAVMDLVHVGSVIIVDNVVRDGRVADLQDDDPRVRGSREALEVLASHPRLRATAIQTVGSKGYDGFAIACVVA
jgi:predicted O-methyltransferase YrrM